MMEENPNPSGVEETVENNAVTTETEPSTENETVDHPATDQEPAKSEAETEGEPIVEEGAPKAEAPTEGEPIVEEGAPAAEAPAEGEPIVEEGAPKAEAPTEGEPIVEEGAPAAEAPAEGEPIVEEGAPKAEALTEGEPIVEEGAPAAEAPTEGEPIVEEGAPKAEAPTEGEPIVEEGAPAAEASEDADPVAEETEPDPARILLDEILADEENLEANLNKATIQELTLLLDGIANHENMRSLLKTARMIRNRVREMEKGEEIDAPALSRYNTVYARFNRKRVEAEAEFEKEKAVNSKLKFELLEELKKIVEEEKVTAINEVREIQEKWRAIGWVLQKDLQDLNQTYKAYLDLYYKLRGQYNALRDLDRQHNLEEKERIIKEIATFIPGDDEDEVSRDEWKEKSDKVKALQDRFRSAGHVPRENLDDLMARYRATLDNFYELRKEFYEEQDEQKKENVGLKEAIIEKLQPYATYTSKKARDWNKATKEVLAFQEEWKKVGPAPRDVNKQLWKNYRQTCDAFFDKKSAFFKEFDQIRATNLEKKQALCEQAEGLMESEDWKETAQKLKDLQTEWKSVGPVHDRYSNKVWKRFRKACDHFFNRRDEANNSRRDDYANNLEKKESLIADLQKLVEDDDPESQVDNFKRLQQEWKDTGHVPMKDKDRVNNAFREGAGAFYAKIKAVTGSDRFINLENLNAGDGGGGGGRRSSRGGRKSGGGGGGGPIFKIRRKIKAAQETLESYQTNILFIAKGRKGDSLRAMIQKQIDEEQAKIDKWKAEIKAIQAAEAAAEAKAEEEANAAEEAESTASEATEAESTDSAEAKNEEE